MKHRKSKILQIEKAVEERDMKELYLTKQDYDLNSVLVNGAQQNEETNGLNVNWLFPDQDVL